MSNYIYKSNILSKYKLMRLTTRKLLIINWIFPIGYWYFYFNITQLFTPQAYVEHGQGVLGEM